MEKRILIVEDHNDMMTFLEKYLEDNDFITDGAKTAESALKKFKKEQPDLILMDLMLPGISGLEAIKKIRKTNTSDSYIPIIIITAKNEVDDIVEGLNSGADDYLVKPFHLEELVARINSALRLKQLNELLLKQTSELKEANDEVGNLNSDLVSKNKQLRKNIYSLHSLFEISIELNSILDLQRLVNSILLTMVGQFSAKSALFMFASKPDIDRLELLNSKGYNLSDLDGLFMDKKDPLLAYFADKKLPVKLSSVTKKCKNSPGLARLKSLDIQLITPISVQNKVEGIICLGQRVKRRAYEELELEHVSILSNIISIAVSNATLYYEVEQLSYTDGMTDLHNFRYFELRLKEEVSRHKRTKNGLSMLFLDVDNFKNYNDTVGHPAGDEVLRKLSAVLRDTVRENDLVARYGGEEFAVILPAVGKAGAAILAERIRENIEKTYFEHEEIQPLGKVTVSIGIASLPDDGETDKELLNASDVALYAAKKEGRNQVMLYSEDLEEK